MAVQTTPNAPADSQSAEPVVPAPPGDSEEEEEEEEEEDDGYESDCSDDSDSSEMSTVTLEGEGMITDLFESSYLPTRKPPKYYWCLETLNYDRCSSRELKAFIAARGLEDPYPAGLTLKWFYIPVLEKADKAPKPFRFLDLPPEMRNMVYTELLTLPDCTCPKHCICFPQILRTSRQIYDEAVPVLYGENHINCTFFAAPRAVGVEKYVRIHTTSPCHHPSPDTNRFSVVPSGMSAYPDFLKRVNHLSININLDYALLDDFDDDAIEMAEVAVMWMGRCLLNLASFLVDGHRLKTLEIHFISDDEYVEYEQADECLYPLRRIRNVTKVMVDGTVDDETIAAIKSELPDTTPAFNTIKAFTLLRDEANAYIKLEHNLDLSKDPYEQGPDSHNAKAASKHDAVAFCAAETHTRAMRRLINEIESRLTSTGFASLHEENKVLDLIAKLQQHVDVAGQTRLSRTIRTLTSATKARARYTNRIGDVENPRAIRGSPEL
ncbi:hypothetical protein LTR85_010288 [Meristemomyces frigidus]|nr:hypothetical protein LTR85_010288 [Meristemomyces frigidus]